MRRILLALSLGLAVLVGNAAEASDFPNRPIVVVVPFPAGGPTDTIARIVAVPMSRVLGQPVVVDNINGDAGVKAVMTVKQARPDGYTLLMGHQGTHGAAPAVGIVPYDPIAAFTPIGVAAATPIVIATRKGLDFPNLAALAEHIRNRGEPFRVAHAGPGSVSHSGAKLLLSILKVDPEMVQYRGTGPAMNDLAAGRVDMMTDQIVNVAPHLRKGSIRAYAVATPERSAAMPDVPTTLESGLSNYQISAWAALFGPKGLDPARAAKVRAALDAALDDDITRRRLMDLGAVMPDPPERGAEALVALMERERVRWRRELAPIAAGDGVP